MTIDEDSVVFVYFHSDVNLSPIYLRGYVSIFFLIQSLRNRYFEKKWKKVVQLKLYSDAKLTILSFTFLLFMPIG